MCGGGSAPQDNSGAIAQQQAAQQQNTIAQDDAEINAVFGGPTGAATPSGFAPVTLQGQTAQGLPAGAYFESVTPTSGKGYALQDGSGNIKGYDNVDTNAAGPNQQPGGTVLGGDSAGQFTPDYYNNITQNYENYYNPQVAQNYQNTLNSLTYQLGQQGILQSNEAARQFGLLSQQDTAENQAVASQAIGAANTAKQQVAQEKAQLNSLAQTAASPSTVSAQVAAGASSAVSPVQFSPISNTFAGLLGQGTNALAIQQGALPTSGSGGVASGSFFSPQTAAVGSSTGGNGGGSQTVV